MGWKARRALPVLAWLAAALVAGASIGDGALAQASSPDGARLAFVTGYVESCVLRSAQAAGAEFARREAETYCRCVAEAAAGELSPDEITRIGAGALTADETGRLSARLEKAALHCAYKR